MCYCPAWFLFCLFVLILGVFIQTEKNSETEAKKLIAGVIRRENSMRAPIDFMCLFSSASGPTLLESLSVNLRRLVLVREFCFCSLLFRPVVYVQRSEDSLKELVFSSYLVILRRPNSSGH